MTDDQELLKEEYAQVIAALPSSCGQVSPDESAQVATLRRIAAKWKQMFGRCAEQSVDSVATKRDDGLYEERHAVFYGNGCTIAAASAFRQTWSCHGCTPPVGPIPPEPPTGPQPTPPPTDPQPPVAGCKPPLPPKVWTAETLPPGYDGQLVGKTRYEMLCRPHGNVIDCTVQNVRACDYCDAIGMGEYDDGQNRCGCPVRPEGAPDREVCEAYLTGGTKLEPKNGATCEFVHENPYMFRPSGGNCRLCGSNGTTYNGERQGCGDWF
jgi:hypothetical protein